MNKKKLFAIIAALTGLIVIAGVLFFYTETHEQYDPMQGETKFMGLLNSSAFGAVKPISAEERHATESSRPTIPNETQVGIDLTISQKLSQGDLTGLDSYLAVVDSTYQDTEKIKDIRIDITNIHNMTPETAETFFLSFRTPEALAGAIIYTPISYKLNAFKNSDSLMFPSMSDIKDSNEVGLTQIDLSDKEKDEKLSLLNEGKVSFEQYTDIAEFKARIWGVPCLIWVVKGEYGWTPYLLEQETNYTINVMTQLKAQRIAKSLYGSRDTVDSVIVFQKFDEDTYLAYMKEHPDEFNEDGSRKQAEPSPLPEDIPSEEDTSED